MDLSVNLSGLRLKNPVIVAAGPWARNAASIQKCMDAGAGAVITETISMEANRNLSPRLYMGKSGQIFNTKLYSNIHLEQWETELESLDRGDCKLIVSIWGSSASELSYLASRAERMGADAVEISIAAPIGMRNQALGFHTHQIESFAQAVLRAVSIPVLVKLSYETSISPEVTGSIQRAGIRIVSAIDSLKGLSGVDIERMQAHMPTYGGYSGDDIRPVALATTAALRQYTAFQICGCGAIHDVVEGLSQWLRAHGYENLDAVRGAALQSLKPFEEIRPRPLSAVVQQPCAEKDCDACAEGCLYDAISRDVDGTVAIDHDRCDGCGLCIARCPKKKLSLGWM